MALATFCASCTNTIELDVKLPEKRLILNALLNAGDEVHIVDLSERTDNMNSPAHDGVEQVHGATITCYVNGEEVAVAEEVFENYMRPYDVAPPAPGGFGSSHYEFRASFRPGDRIRLEARRDDEVAYAEVTVPEPAELEFVDMESYIEKVDQWSSRSMLDVDFRISDVAGSDSYYRVGDPSRDMDLLFHFYDDSGNKTGEDVTSQYVDGPKVYIDNDPILNDGYMPGGTEDIFSELNPVNAFKVFTDNQFRDRGAEVSLRFDMTVNEYSLFYLVEGYPRKVDVESVLKINIETLDFKTYNYYKALNAGESYGYDISFLMEPIIFPSNVVGGLGFVGISSSTILEIPLPAQSFEKNPILYT